MHEITGSLYELETGIKYAPLYMYCPFFYVRSINKELLLLQDNILDYIKLVINKDYYFITWVNHFDNPLSSKYHTEEFEDGIIIYGYNDDEQVFNCAGFIDGKYTLFTFNYNDINLSIIHDSEENLYSKNITLIKFDSSFSYALCREDLIWSIEDYLLSQDRSKRFFLIIDKKYWYGLDYYDKVKEQYVSSFKDMRLLHNLVDQKEMMSNRLEYLYRNNILDLENYAMLNTENELMKNKLILLRNKTIKNNMKDVKVWPEKDINKFLIDMDDIKEKDRKFCEKFLKLLR